MSKHPVETKLPTKHICFIGYDAPLQTYFAQVLDRETFEPEELGTTRPEDLIYDDENLVLWIGTNPAEFRTVSELQDRIAEYAEIPEQVITSLHDERTARNQLSPLQREMRELIRGWSTSEQP